MAIYGKVIEVNTEYGYIGLSIGKGTRVYRQLGPARSVEIDPVIVPGMELKVYRGLLEGGKVQYVSTVKLNKVNDDCSIANLPVNADIQVGDSICFELTDANAALKKYGDGVMFQSKFFLIMSLLILAAVGATVAFQAMEMQEYQLFETIFAKK